MDITSYLLGKQAGGGGGGVVLQNNKNVSITSNGSTIVNPDDGYDAMKKTTITTNVQPNLESKNITITQNGTTTITPTSGKDGLSSVNVITNIPQPAGSISINANGTYDVTNYASAEVAVGGSPTKGVIFDDWDNNGYPHTARVVGQDTMGMYYFQAANNGSNGLTCELETIVLPNNVTTIPASAFFTLKNLKNINLSDTQVTSLSGGAFNGCTALALTSLPNSITSIGTSCFNNCSNLALETLPSNLTTMEAYAFSGCNKLAIKTLPIGVTQLNSQVFRSCIAIHQISMPSVQTIYNGSYAGAFHSVAEMRAIWIGSSLTSIGRYSLQGISENKLKRIYIDLPRATVEALPGYDYAFCNIANNISKIVCNDDAGFMTQAEFDAIDWDTYTP